MVALFAQEREVLFGILPGEASFEQRGAVPSNLQSQAQLKPTQSDFFFGYTTTFHGLIPNFVVTRLSELWPRLQGFAYEAVVLAIVLLILGGTPLATTHPSQLMHEHRRPT